MTDTEPQRHSLYHGTSPEAAEKILHEGLKPNGMGFCYLSPQQEIARHFGTGAVLEVDPPDDMNLTAFEDCADWEVFCWGTIPPDRIRMLETRYGC